MTLLIAFLLIGGLHMNPFLYLAAILVWIWHLQAHEIT